MYEIAGSVVIGGEIETKECDTSPCPIDCEGSGVIGLNVQAQETKSVFITLPETHNMVKHVPRIRVIMIQCVIQNLKEHLHLEQRQNIHNSR